MKFPKVLVTFYKEQDPSKCRCAWVNYNEDGCFINVTSYYGKVLQVSNDGKVKINNDVWVSKMNLNINIY
ncbi:hypothetical protein [Acinetobacter shaoyimingii]|uniref:hypothetical protein n=1 Tax=Acinetobacter shaoyimingii TaxID=2715164 RepID=UPI001D0F24FA|nr:hypothetical protein [Acinetobacter shaoyimingii]